MGLSVCLSELPQHGGWVPQESGPTETGRSYITFCDLASGVIKPAQNQNVDSSCWEECQSHISQEKHVSWEVPLRTSMENKIRHNHCLMEKVNYLEI